MTPELLAILRDEIMKDPADRGYNQGADAAATAELLNSAYEAEVTPAADKTGQTLRWSDVRGVAQAAGEWPNIVIRSEERPATDTVKAAINACATAPEQEIDPNDPKAWGAFEAGLQLFKASGDLSAATVDMILGMTTVPIPAVTEWRHARWLELILGVADAPNAVTADDVTEALA